MTAPLCEDLSALEFSIPCEGDHCDSTAAVMCKACGDSRYFAICRAHLAYARHWFESQGYVVCDACYRPWLFFDTHFSIVPI